MTTRDPRSRAQWGSAKGQGRDPTQSLSLPPEDEAQPSSLALGTHEAAGQRSDEPTRVDSPQARSKTPAPPRPATKPPPMPRDDPEGRIGSVLGNYRVTELLGKGGMGCVYRAEHTKLGREVALKMLRSDYAKRKDAVSRFMQEARTVNRVRHRNIVDVPDILELDDGTTCIVMELLHGQSLGKWARQGIDLPRALAMLVQICDGLAAAHAVGVIHRDLKPDNVIVVPTSDGAELVKLLDFGVAKLLNRDDEDVGFQTAAGSVIGTPAYMSPEQAGGMPVDARSDIYSLGAMMYELFCGQPLFKGRSFGEFVRKHLTELPVPPRQTEGGAHLDERIEAVILRAIEKDPARRYQHVNDLRDDLLAMLGGLETHPPGVPVAPQAATSAIHSPASAIHAPASATMSALLPPPLPGPPSTPGVPVAALQTTPPPAYAMTQVGARAPSLVTASTPWWVWLAGGAVIISLAIGGAVLAMGSGDSIPSAADEFLATPSEQPVTAPTPTQPTPAEPPPAGPTAKPTGTDVSEAATPPTPAVQAGATQIELRFDSLPSAGVYADGRSTELCQTPCTFNVDGAQGDDTIRTFVVKRDGYRDARVEVDLAKDTRAFNVTLEQLMPTAGTAAKPDRPRGKKPAGKPKATPGGDKAVEPVDPPEKKPAGKIDRTYTRDPFKSDR